MRNKFYSFFTIIGEYALYGLLFFLAISNALVEIFVVLAFFGFIGRKIIKPDFRYLKFWPNIFLFFFILFSALSLFNSGEFINKSLHALLGKWAQYLGICIIIQDSIYDKKIIKQSMFVFLFGASLAVLSGLSQHFFGVEFLRNRTVYVIGGGIQPITSSFTHYNNFGGYLVIVLSLVFTLLLAENSFNLKVVSLLSLSVFSTAAIIFTFSRGSWLAAFTAFISMAIISRKNLKWLVPVFMLIFVLFLFPDFHGRLLFTFKAYGDADRFRYWLVARKMISEHPFLGMGTGTFMANFSKFQPYLSPAYAHNCYLQIWAETGIFSLVSFTAFISSLIYLAIKKLLVYRDSLLLGLLSGVMGFLAHSFFDTNLYSLQLAVLFWVWAGLIVRRMQAV